MFSSRLSERNAKRNEIGVRNVTDFGPLDDGAEGLGAFARRVAPAGLVDVGERFELPALPPLKWCSTQEWPMLASRARCEQSRQPSANIARLLRARLDEVSVLTPGEHLFLDELLRRLSNSLELSCLEGDSRQSIGNPSVVSRS
jgi:hypothetical protein